MNRPVLPISSLSIKLPMPDRSVESYRLAASRSFPAKLLYLLADRFQRTATPLTILPCELISHNGRALRALLDDLAHRWGEGASFKTWLASQVTICDSACARIA